MSEVVIRKTGAAGHVTLNRPAALNALTWDMCTAIDAALIEWAEDPAVSLVMIDGAGPRAFCAGGDIAAMYAAGRAGDFDSPRRFWRDEYRMNARIDAYPKPIVAFMQGFVMGGGVGIGGHASHRIVGETTQVAMPECAIGLVPDVGGCALLARAPGRLGEYLGVTGARMGPADAIHAGFADAFVPEAGWDALKARLAETGDIAAIGGEAPPPGRLAALGPQIDALFAGETAGDIARLLERDPSPFAAEALAALRKGCPLSAACTVEMLHRLGDAPTVPRALELEYRFTHRAMQDGDFLEGVRAAIIDKDRKPVWTHARVEDVPGIAVSRMLMPLGRDAWRMEEERT
ncbi:MAG: enoyl-CoA hydratase/isomerase family protein [Gemmobacter sp.]